MSRSAAKHWLMGVVAALISASAAAGAINKCTMKDGTVVYQDMPCAAAAASEEAIKTYTRAAFLATDGRPQSSPTYRSKARPRLRRSSSSIGAG